jgi:hypothetical protein
VIPWATILKHAPTILAAADALRVRTRASSAAEPARSHDARLGELEERSRASAQLAQEMAQQLQALTMAQESMARQLRLAVRLSAAAAVIAAVGGILAIVL